MYTKRGEIYQIATKYAKWPQNITNGRKIHKHFPRPSKIYPNCDFWSENKPSGNPGAKDVRKSMEVLQLLIL
jgi:hypothetical protein